MLVLTEQIDAKFIYEKQNGSLFTLVLSLKAN
jgi:hypothetical protein